MTHGLNTVADGLRLAPDFSPAGRPSLVDLDGEVAPDAKATLDEVAAFYAMDRAPAVFRYLGRDPGFLAGYWGATRVAFGDGALDRLTKEVLALAASLTARSDYGVDLHLREVRRLGLPERGVLETVEVVQCFNTVTKIADALQLQPDFPARLDS